MRGYCHEQSNAQHEYYYQSGMIWPGCLGASAFRHTYSHGIRLRRLYPHATDNTHTQRANHPTPTPKRIHSNLVANYAQEDVRVLRVLLVRINSHRLFGFW